MQRPGCSFLPHTDLDQRRVKFMRPPPLLAHRPVAEGKGAVVLCDVDVAHPTDHRVGRTSIFRPIGKSTAARPLNICLSTVRSRPRIVGDCSATSEASASAPRPVAVIAETPAETPWLASSSGTVNSHDRFMLDPRTRRCETGMVPGTWVHK